MRRKTAFILLVLTVITVGCKKYEEGPAFSLYSKGQRVAGRWYFDRVAYNDVDSIEVYNTNNIEFILHDSPGKDKGAYTWDRQPGGQAYDPNLVYFGSWQFFADKDSVRWIVLNKDVQDTTDWRIIRLAYDQFWLERQYNDSTVLRWNLWKMVF
ncbi:MAG: hypothetical protein HN352_05760 [Bacteroidetes bacterium]|jgi:hypothetical protein|nr:hypothetical protein [Bacteroidota bacterium]MBT3750586.1 hypothetical protein [Bacteroidota bacterium]MBT4401416.1 hypothetical protein [Bacteroidota bacterium]MBT4410646.1 hypothetical protein [Bacteroidota bacterium]MBT7093662.1 hypothetical protein [Bacteroidota bacterium]